jgi:hypothetical protein
MSAVGPELPPHLLAKRKRQAENEANELSKLGNTSATQISSAISREKKQRVIGPSLSTPATDATPLQKKNEINDESSSSEDDIGPVPATPGSAETVCSCSAQCFANLTI